MYLVMIKHIWTYILELVWMLWYIGYYKLIIKLGFRVRWG